MNTQTTSPTTTFPQPYITPNDDVSPHNHIQHHSSPSSSSSTSSLIIVLIVISSAIILTATIYFTIRYISRRTSNNVNDVVSLNLNLNLNLNNEHVNVNPTEVTNNNNDLGLLPLFKFSSLTGNMMSSSDCAVCLSRFESEDQLRLLPLCCHAFHALCIDAWLKSNFTCPLCRSNVNPTEEDISSATGNIVTGATRSNSFRIEIGSISNNREPSGSQRRSYSVGSFEYVVDVDGYEVNVESMRPRGESDGDKESTVGVGVAPGENVAAEVGSGRGNWLRRSLRGSGRLFSTGSSRRSGENVVDERIGEEISEFFRWFSGV